MSFHTVTMPTKVRKYDVDKEKLKTLLKAHKNKSISEIAEELNIPKTQVEHWFRRDKYFSIPEPELWFKLKELLNIQTDEFDESITTFIEADSTFDSKNRIYYGDVSATLTTNSENDLYLIGG